MAIITTIRKIKSIGFPTDILNYLEASNEPSTKTSKRIFDLPVESFKKFNLYNDVFSFEQVFMTKHRDDCFWESHKKFVDIQLVLKGEELMEYCDIDKLDCDASYDTKKDLITYKPYDQSTRILLQAGDIAIFYPDDAHMGMPQYRQSSQVFKTVVKLPVDLL